MKLIVTVFEESAEAAIAVIRSLRADHDGVEVRAERFAGYDPGAIRAATDKPLILTWRGRKTTPREMEHALAAGIDLVDVEFDPSIKLEIPPERVVLSHHDFDGMGEIEQVANAMSAFGCAHTKIAVTPHTFSDNQRLLGMLGQWTQGESALAVIGMGERGLYTRILAPFVGSELTFVAASAAAAPGQLTLDHALAIYGSSHERSQRPERVFAVVGNPAGHSHSPMIHNRLFRQKGVPAAYTIASIESFSEITQAFLQGEPAGLSVTAPFKEEAYAFALDNGAEIAANAAACGAVNTLVNAEGRILADNTDVDGFQALLRRAVAPPVSTSGEVRVAVVGAGGTARAAVEAARRESMHVTVFNRTAGRLGAAPLEELSAWRGDVGIDTTPGEAELPFHVAPSWIRAAYGTGRTEPIQPGVRLFRGEELLEAQALRQNELFCAAVPTF